MLVATLAWPLAGAAQTAPATDARTPMQFEWVREGPADVCRDRCREWISATGAIVDTTPRDFEAFAKSRNLQGAMVVLESSGGSVLAGLTLGRLFRRLGVTTMVGHTGKAAGDARATLSPRASCNSMCVFLLLGGVHRVVPDEARVLVHQIWPQSKRDDAAAATYSASEMVATQRVLGQIARYTVDMGADIELFEMATRVPPWEGLRPLSRDELRRLHVDTGEGAVSAAPAGRQQSATTSPATAPVANPAAALGWVLIGQADQRKLLRRHPLTVDGQQIGSFEIWFACGEAPGVYRVGYVEKRTSGSDETDRLDVVGISVRREHALLKVESSTRGPATTELVSVAQGVVPAALLDAFGGTGDQTLIIATSTTSKARTMISIGRSGLAKSLAEMVAGCRR